MKIRKSLLLTPEQWQVLDRLAEQTRSEDTYHKSGDFSWRIMLRRVADRELAVVNKQNSDLLANIEALKE